jgi:hypothetical protein
MPTAKVAVMKRRVTEGARKLFARATASLDFSKIYLWAVEKLKSLFKEDAMTAVMAGGCPLAVALSIQNDLIYNGVIRFYGYFMCFFAA